MLELAQIKEIILPILAEQNVELIELAFRPEAGKLVLRFLVDKPGGILLDECARLNRQISQILDAKNIIEESYILEVASPGLDRPIKSKGDFQRSLGKLVKIVLHQPLNRQNVWIGILEGVDDKKAIMRTEKGEKVNILCENIAKAKLEIK